MEKINKFQITHDLILNWVDSLLLTKSKEFIISFSPKYNYTTNTLAGMDFKSRGDLKLLRTFINLFDLTDHLEIEENYLTWKEDLYNSWFVANTDNIMETVTNGEVSHYYILKEKTHEQ